MNQKLKQKNNNRSVNNKDQSTGKKPMKRKEEKPEENNREKQEAEKQAFNDAEQGSEININQDQQGMESEDVSKNPAEEKLSEVDGDENQENDSEKLQTELQNQKEQYLRLLAEFENFKKRSLTESQTRLKYANQSLVSDIINGLDNLERAVEHADVEDASAFQEFIKGVGMVQQQLYDALQKHDVVRIFPVGELFNPNQHEAVGVIESDSVEPDHIAEVFQAGYLIHDRVIRPAMVQVVKK